MNKQEIDKIIKKYNILDEYYNFNTPKGTYGTYCLICIFENRKLEVTRIINNKCEIKVFRPRKWFVYSLV